MRENKQITLTDITRIGYASGLNFFTNSENRFTPFLHGIYYTLIGYYVKRISSNSYYVQSFYTTSSSGNYWGNTGRNCDSSASTKSLSEIEDIDKSLVCDKDEDERVVIEYAYRRVNWGNSQYKKHKLGLFLINPPIRTSIDKRPNDFFNYRIIFTPKSGIFPVKK